MKDKILVFIIGLLVGAIIATGCYYFYSKTHVKTNNHGDRPAMMSQDGNSTGMPSGTPPSMPSNDQNGASNHNQGQPPAMPGQQNTDSNTNTQTQTTNSNS